MEFPTLAKPWTNAARYREARAKEARVEADLALEFLGNGLVRNAAGKAFQAWKAYLGSLAVEHREELRRLYPGARRVVVGEEEVVVEDVDVVIAVVPTTQMMRIAKVVARRVGDWVLRNTVIALELHRYQYNGPDPEGFYTTIPDDSTAAELICALVRDLAEPGRWGSVCATAQS